jgi:hypothetical protein
VNGTNQQKVSFPLSKPHFTLRPRVGRQRCANSSSRTVPN